MGKKIKIDMTGVESYGRVSEGQHVVKIVAAEPSVSQGGGDTIRVTFQVVKGSDKGNKVIETYPLVETALWKLKGLLVALGMKCDGKITLDVDKLVGKTLIIEVHHEEYNGSMRAKVSECKKLASDADEDTDEDDEDFDEDDEDEDEDDEEEETPKKKASKKAPAKKKPTSSKKKPKQEEEEDEDDEFEDDEDEDEEPAPKKKSSKKAPAKKAPAKKKPAKKVVEDEDDDEDDEDWEEDDE